MPDIKGREVFSVGTWNGDKYTEQDLDDMVTAHKATKDLFKPYMKLGHNKEQKLLQKDGLPSAGWITNLYRKGKKLLADMNDIPDKIYKLMQTTAYPYVSSEIFWDITVDGKKYHRMLAGVALLGADMPAVTNLDDFLSLYGIDHNSVRKYTNNTDDIESKLYQIKQEDDDMPEIKKLQDQLAELTKKYSATEEAKKADDAEKLKLQDEIKEYKANQLKLEQENKEKDIEKFILENKIAPSMHGYVKAILGDEKKEYTIEKKNYTKQEILGEFLKLYKDADVNLDENSSDKKLEKDTDLDKVKKYAKDNDCSLREAYTAMEEKSDENDDSDE